MVTGWKVIFQNRFGKIVKQHQLYGDKMTEKMLRDSFGGTEDRIIDIQQVDPQVAFEMRQRGR